MASEPSGTKQSSLRLLILAPASSPSAIPPFPTLLNALTGSSPSKDVTSFAGYTSHPPIRLRTKYYQSDVSIWCDELPLPLPISTSTNPTINVTSERGTGEWSLQKDDDSGQEPTTATLEDWKEQMLSDPAAEVRAVIGGLILVLPVSTLPASDIPASFTTLVEVVHALREAIEDDSYGRDIAAVVILQGMSPAVKQEKLDALMEQLEESCLSDKGILGWDFVAWDVHALDESTEADVGQKNEYGEQTGIKRALEVIEGIDWSASPNLNDDDEEEFDIGGAEEEDELGFSSTRDILGSGRFSGLDDELQREMMELKFSMLENDGDDGDDGDDGLAARRNKDTEDEDRQVDQLPALMERVVAIREAGSEMPQAERERFAKREIGRIMREMG